MIFMFQRSIFIVVLLSVVALISFAQDPTHVTLNGNVKLLVGDKIVTADHILLLLNNTNKITETNANGNFRFTQVKPGKYHLKTADEIYIKVDTVITASKNSKFIQLYLTLNCEEYTAFHAKEDIRNHKIKLLLASGIAMTTYPGDINFQKKYQLQFYDFGCIQPDINCIIQYNKTIFAYLDQKHGIGWRKEVRKDVVGLHR